MDGVFLAWWLYCFALTELLEAPLAWVLLSRAGAKPGRALASALLASLWTHPFLFSATWFLDLPPVAWLAVVSGLELVVALSEALWHRKFLGLPWREALVASFAANGFSYGLGLLIV